MVSVSRDLATDIMLAYNDTVRRSLLACDGWGSGRRGVGAVWVGRHRAGDAAEPTTVALDGCGTAAGDCLGCGCRLGGKTRKWSVADL